MTKARNLTTLASVNTTISGNTVYINGNVSFANATLSLGANTVNSTTLTSTGVVANSYGNTTAIPVITVDAAGRITNATTSSVSGVTGLSFTSANSTITVSTSTTNFDAVVTSGNSSVQGLLRVIDSVSNTSTSIAAAANSVTTAYLLAANAVSNATAYAATAYSNAVATAASDATTKAGTAYSNATTYAATVAGTAYSNAVSVAASDATTKAGTAYSNAATYAATIAGTAYSNATSYADTKAATAYSNATAYADTKAGTAYSNAVAYTDIKAGNAYSNAASYADTKAAAAYSNVFNGGTFSGAVTVQANLTANSVRMNGNLQVDGDLTVSGNTVTINVTNLNVEDNMIYLNSNSVVTHPDLGFAGNYNDGSYKHAGLFRDATDGVWKFFHGYTPEPDASVYIDTANASFTLSNLQINYVIGNVTGSANSATYLGGNTAATLRSYSDTMAGTAYSNATTYAATIAGTAYSNAVSVAASDATTKAGTAYSNATTYAATIAGTAYSNATSYAATIAGTAYSNAVSVAASDATTKAGTAYSNATSYAATIAGTAYSNATSYAATIAGTAYSNAVAYAASNSYVNSTFLKLSGGTLTGQLISSTPSNYTAITSVTADTAKFRVPEVSVGGAAGFIPALGQTSIYSGGYRQHLVLGNYRTASTWGGGMFVGLGGNDSYPTEYFLLNYGGTFSHTNGYVTTLGSSRSPLFYDSDDTAYYLSPASSGGIALETIGEIRLKNNAGTYTHFNYSNGGTSNYIRGTTYFDGSTVQFSSGNLRWSGAAYDNDDTGYYIDPNSTLSANFAGHVWIGSTSYANPGGWSKTLTLDGTNHARIRLKASAYGSYGANETYLWLDNTVTPNSGIVAPNVFYLNASYTQMANSARAPIFYDLDDTSYYVDPNSNSELSGFTSGTKARAGMNIHHYNRQSQTSDTNYWTGSQGWGNAYTWNSALTLLGSCFMDFWGTSSTHPQGSGYVHAQGLQILHYRDGGGGDTNVSYGWQMVGAGDAANRWWLRGKWGSTIRSWYEICMYGTNVGGTLYPSISYDSDNTGYYVDANSTSRMGTINSDLLRSYSNVYIDNNYGYGVVGVYSSYRYQGVFAMGDSYKLPADGTSTGSLYGLAWSHPNAGGVAANLNTHGLLAMENGTWLASLSGSVRARDDMRAPIFYDRSDTGYYCDPNDTSVFWHAKTYGGITVNNGYNTGYGINLYSGSGYQPTYGIVFAGTGTYGTHGSVTSDWSTFFTMNDDTARGWVFRRGGTNVASISGGGNGYFNGNVTAYSDIRVKTNIENITNAVDKVNKLRGVTYDRTDDPTQGRQTGVIAQEVLEVLPEAVGGSEEKGYYVAYGNMVGLLIEAIKEQQTFIEAQEARIAKLEALINKLVS